MTSTSMRSRRQQGCWSHFSLTCLSLSEAGLHIYLICLAQFHGCEVCNGGNGSSFLTSGSQLWWRVLRIKKTTTVVVPGFCSFSPSNKYVSFCLKYLEWFFCHALNPDDRSMILKFRLQSRSLHWTFGLIHPTSCLTFHLRV